MVLLMEFGIENSSIDIYTRVSLLLDDWEIPEKSFGQRSADVSNHKLNRLAKEKHQLVPEHQLVPGEQSGVLQNYVS